MVEEGRSAIDIAQQMRAAIRALARANSTLITHYIEHHLETATVASSEHARRELAQLAELARYL